MLACIFSELRRLRLPVLSCIALAFLALAITTETVAFAEDAPPTGSADPQIAAALRQISASRIQSTIEKLVGFKPRSPLSAQDRAAIEAGHGIGAAREWIKSEFERYARDCGGC